MENFMHNKLKQQLAESIRWAERAKFWRDFRRSFADSIFKIGCIASILFAIDLAHRGQWRPAQTLSVALAYAVLLGLATAWANRAAIRWTVLHNRAGRVGLVRRKRESSASFERRIALQEQMADLP